MKIALVHYHLNTGGVTTVLKRQIAALQDHCDLLVLTGDGAAVQLPCPVEEIPGLGYDRPGGPLFPPKQTAGQVLASLHRKWPLGCDLLHIHNPILAKNRQFLQILRHLQQAGLELFLQVHDFAEDGRPNVYFDEPYPENCHYGVINTRDMSLLRRAGLTEAGVHYLPNAVEEGVGQVNRTPKPQVLYPVRTIRRKNLGEAVLLSLFFKQDQRLVVTQPPSSPTDAASSRDWDAWIRDNRLPIDLEAGQKKDFETLVADSESIVTTSIAEGFGMVYLEPWMAGKPLWGRRLQDVCVDFETSGIRLDWLYNRLNIPLDWFDGNRFSASWHTAVFEAAGRFGHLLPADRVTDAFDRIVDDGEVDFGLLNEALQRQVLIKLIGDIGARKTLMQMNPWLADAGSVLVPGDAIQANRNAVLRHYGLDRYRGRLMGIYERVVGRVVRQHIDKDILRDVFFDLDRFSLLKWGPYEEA